MNTPVILASSSLPSPPLSPMVKVYWLHSGWLDPPALLSGASGAFDEEPQAAITVVTASSTAVAPSRKVVWDMRSPVCCMEYSNGISAGWRVRDPPTGLPGVPHERRLLPCRQLTAALGAARRCDRCS